MELGEAKWRWIELGGGGWSCMEVGAQFSNIHQKHIHFLKTEVCKLVNS